MKKLPIISIIVIIIIGLGVAIYLVIQNNGSEANTNTSTSSLANTVVQTNISSEPSMSAGQKYTGSGFSIDIPEGWSVTDPITGTLGTIVKADETHPDGSKAQEISFKSYMAISSGDAQGRTITQMSEYIQQEILATSPSATVSASSPGSTVQGMPVENSIIRLTVDEVKYAIFLMVTLKDDKYFAVSANTTNEKWEEYKNIFLNTTASLDFD